MAASQVPTRLLNRALFQPPERGRKSPRSAGLDYQRLTIETSDGERLRGWWVRTRARRRGHILFFHGNGEDISGCIQDAELLTGVGFDVLLSTTGGTDRTARGQAKKAPTSMRRRR